jgi:hypothetical protein
MVAKSCCCKQQNFATIKTDELPQAVRIQEEMRPEQSSSIFDIVQRLYHAVAGYGMNQ